MHGDGLEASEFWGVTGPSWRTLDIIVATFCLARTASHAVGASHPATLGTLIVLSYGHGVYFTHQHVVMVLKSQCKTNVALISAVFMCLSLHPCFAS